MQAHYDVVILGGGLAGLTLARQLRQERPGLQVLVLEKRAHPAPEAAHKVGESSVEIGAHYFGQVLGLHEHMVELHQDVAARCAHDAAGVVVSVRGRGGRKST